MRKQNHIRGIEGDPSALITTDQLPIPSPAVGGITVTLGRDEIGSFMHGLNRRPRPCPHLAWKRFGLVLGIVKLRIGVSNLAAANKQLRNAYQSRSGHSSRDAASGDIQTVNARIIKVGCQEGARRRSSKIISLAYLAQPSNLSHRPRFLFGNCGAAASDPAVMSAANVRQT